MWKLPDDPDGKIFIWTLVVMFALTLGSMAITGLWEVWPELRKDVLENPTEAIRNIALTLTAPVALAALYLTWRRNQQTMRQVQTQIRQAESAEFGQYHDRFQSALKMLESEQENIQMAGVTLLDRIRHEMPTEFDETVMNLFCDMVSNKLVTHATMDTADLWELDYKSNFSPAVNGRIMNLLMHDTLGQQRDKSAFLAVTESRIDRIARPIDFPDDDRKHWQLTVSGCHIQSLDCFHHVTRRFNFNYCQIDKLRLELWKNAGNSTYFFGNCVIGELEIQLMGREMPDRADLDRIFYMTECRYDMGGSVNLDDLFTQATESRIYVDGLRLERTPY